MSLPDEPFDTSLSDAGAGGTAEEQLAALLAKAYVLADGLTKRVAGSDRDLELLATRVAQIEAENTTLADQNTQLLRQHSAMVMLFVSSERLHASLEPAEVASSIWEILVNLIGAEEFLIAVRTEESQEAPYDFVTLEGIDRARALAALERDPLVARALAEGNVVMATEPVPDTALAAVPLRLADRNDNPINMGLIVIFKLLDHKPHFAAEDGDVLSLLGGHAATAFVGATAYARLHRKVKTMESLMNLLKK